MHVTRQLDRHGQLLGGLEHLVVTQADELANLLVHRAHVTHGLDHVTGAGLALGANHRGPLGDAAQRLTHVLRTAHERHVELCLVDVIDVIGRRKHFGLVDVVDVDGLQDAGFSDVPDAHLRHDRNGDGLLNALDHGRVAHTRDAAGGTDISGDALQRHDRARAGVLGDPSLLGSRHVHDHAALEHLRQVLVQFRSVFSH